VESLGYGEGVGGGGTKGVGCGLGGTVATTSTKPAAFRECSSAWGA